MNTAGGPQSTSLHEHTPSGAYTVILSSRVRQQLQDAPPVLQGYLAGITAILRIDPTAASTMIQIRLSDDDAWTATYASGRGFLTYWVLDAQQLVVLLDWIWAG